MDKRGGMLKNYNKKEIKGLKKINFTMKENLFSIYKKKNVVRGLYMQQGKFAESKFITLLYGKVTWIIVNMQKKSKNFLKSYKIKLNPNLLLYVPKNYLHGSVSHKKSLIHIMCNNIYNDTNSLKVNWQDPKLKIKWPIDKKSKIIISDDCKNYGFLK
tara:strand:+ start:1252 stop:1725 length:474 start_codon:yes stop_codon:yes gene_type:complete